VVLLAEHQRRRKFQAIEAMDEEDKNVVKKLIDAFITKKQLQKLMQ
jgi:hypothetical protein